MNQQPSSPTILMCPPDYFGIEYEINPWMSRSRQADTDRAREQWASLHALIQQLGAQVLRVDPKQGLPDLVFTANAALIYRRQAFLANFRHAARQPETPVFRKWFTENGFEVIEIPDHLPFEGAGDALFLGETLFGGYIIRSDAKAIQWVADNVGCRALPLQLADPFYYHLDTCFCPLSQTELIWYPAAFDQYARRVIENEVPTAIVVEPEEAARFACNAVVIGKHIVLNTGCPRLTKALEAHGYTVHATELDEFIKAGGSAKCLTLRLDGEDSASWRKSTAE